MKNGSSPIPKLKTKYDELTNHVFDMHVKAVNIRSETKMFRSNNKDLDILHGENHFFPLNLQYG
jgi:hypothetical protein